MHDYNLIMILLAGSIKAGMTMSEHMERTGHPLYAAISMLECCMDILGDMQPVSASMTVTDSDIKANAYLKADNDV